MVLPITFAHRGARVEFPENTIPAFQRGLEAGATGLESDAWLSGDGEVVLVHDATVGGGRKRQKVRELTATQLAAFGVPRLADLYAELGTAYELSIDAKHHSVVAPMLAVADAAGATERLWICMPDLGRLAELRGRTAARLVHSLRRDRISGQLERHAHELAQAGVDAMNMHHTEWTAGLVSLFHRFEVRTFGWDAQEVRHIQALLRIGIDGLYCDRPDRMVETVSQWATQKSATRS